MSEKIFWSCACLAVAGFIGAVASGIYLFGNYDYRWKQQCAVANGVQMENLQGGRVCVRGPVQILTIAARPW